MEGRMLSLLQNSVSTPKHIRDMVQAGEVGSLEHRGSPQSFMYAFWSRGIALMLVMEVLNDSAFISLTRQVPTQEGGGI